MSNPFIGEIRMFGFTFAPRGWAFCQGQILNISQNTALFSLLGTTYGGNGQTTFALPNLQSRAVVGMGQGGGLSSYVAGQTAGAETVILTTQQLAAHTHTLIGDTGTATTNVPTGGTLAAANTGSGRPAPAVPIYSSNAPNSALNGNSIGSTGSNQPHNNIQPVIAMNYCIALQGIFPSRS